MSFEDRIVAFSDRFLTSRTFELIVAPSLADLQFEDGHTAGVRLRNRLAVLRAVAGGLIDEVTRDSVSFLVLALLPAAYYTFLLIVFADFFPAPGGLVTVATLILVLSFAPVLACFWPTRQPARQTD
jgi:hypothetical protein